MSEFQTQLVILAFDKGLLALVIAIFGIVAKRYLDRLNAQNAYHQKLAEERLRTYKEISRIVSQQLMLMGRFANLFTGEHTHRAEEEDEQKKKRAAKAGELYDALRQSYYAEMPKLQSDIIFISSDLADLIIEYLDAFNGFMNIPLDMLRGDSSRLPERGLIDIASRITHKISEELPLVRV